MNLEDCLDRWRADQHFLENVTAWEIIPSSPALLEPLPSDLHPQLINALRQVGINTLYSHQSAALQAAWAGHHVVLVTHTASGKTLAYNLPVLDLLLRDENARALYLFPTKALTQDQLTVLHGLLAPIQASHSRRGDQPWIGKSSQLPQTLAPSGNSSPIAKPRFAHPPNTSPNYPVTPAIYDGDTPAASRRYIRETARLILTNPDMLHVGILPHHTSWADFFRGLRFIVIDEMHIYRGVFGSHVANVIRRLKRIASFYGSTPQFILTSATIANPLELAKGLIEPGPEPDGGIGLDLIDQDGAAHGARHFLIYNPPLIDQDLGLRRSAIQEGAQIASDLLTYHVQTILFARSRRSVEILLTYLRERSSQDSGLLRRWNKTLSPEDANQLPRIRGYRSGYLPQQRREIEQGLRAGQVKAVVATTALELGIDIGAMNAALLVGYPGSIAATWQQSGRAGRGEDSSLSILIATPDPLDQYLAAHPEYFFGRSPEQALINPDNLMILLAHIRCAAFELPFKAGEGFGDLDPQEMQEFLDFLVDERVLHISNPPQGPASYYWMADQYPAQSVSLRSASNENIILQLYAAEEGTLDASSPSVIGAVDRISAYWMVHPHAVYLHEGKTYLVDDLDLKQNIAYLRQVEVDYYTEHRKDTSVQLIESFQQSPITGAIRFYGEILVTSQVIGYRQIHWQTRQQIGMGELSLPPTELQTTAFWLSITQETTDSLRFQGLWSNDANDYGQQWPRIRDLVRARDGYRCQLCGIPEKDRQHAVHHKVPFRTFTSPAAANQLDNLVTLCPTCHRKVEMSVRIRSGLSGLGFILVNLAPLFLMCDIRDLGLHIDPQSPLANSAAGLPTVVIYDQIPAGIGLSKKLFEIYPDLLQRAYQLVVGCPCSDGCPSCVGPGGEQGSGSKQETLALLKILVSQE